MVEESDNPKEEEDDKQGDEGSMTEAEANSEELSKEIEEQLEAEVEAELKERESTAEEELNAWLGRQEMVKEDLMSLLHEEVGKVKKKKKEEEPKDKRREMLKKKMEEFESQGYDITPLKKIIGGKDVDEIWDKFVAYMDGISMLEEAEAILDTIPREGHEIEITAIKKKMDQPLRGQEILKVAKVLKKKTDWRHRSEGTVRMVLETKLKDWKKKGYVTDGLESALKAEDVTVAEKAFKEYEDKLERLKSLEKELDQMTITKDMETEYASLKSMMKDPNDLKSVETGVREFRVKFRKERKRNEFREKLQKYREDGYVVERLEEVIDKDLNKVMKEFFEFERDLETLKSLESKVDALANHNVDDETIQELYMLLNDPSNIAELRERTSQIEKKVIKERREEEETGAEEPEGKAEAKPGPKEPKVKPEPEVGEPETVKPEPKAEEPKKKRKAREEEPETKKPAEKAEPGVKAEPEEILDVEEGGMDEVLKEVEAEPGEILKPEEGEEEVEETEAEPEEILKPEEGEKEVEETEAKPEEAEEDLEELQPEPEEEEPEEEKEAPKKEGPAVEELKKQVAKYDEAGHHVDYIKNMVEAGNLEEAQMELEDLPDVIEQVDKMVDTLEELESEDHEKEIKELKHNIKNLGSFEENRTDYEALLEAVLREKEKKVETVMDHMKESLEKWKDIGIDVSSTREMLELFEDEYEGWKTSGRPVLQLQEIIKGDLDIVWGEFKSIEENMKRVEKAKGELESLKDSGNADEVEDLLEELSDPDNIDEVEEEIEALKSGGARKTAVKEEKEKKSEKGETENLDKMLKEWDKMGFDTSELQEVLPTMDQEEAEDILSEYEELVDKVQDMVIELKEMEKDNPEINENMIYLEIMEKYHDLEMAEEVLRKFEELKGALQPTKESLREPTELGVNDLIKRGNMAYQSGDYDEGLKYLEKALSKDPGNKKAKFYQKRCKMAMSEEGGTEPGVKPRPKKKKKKKKVKAKRGIKIIPELEKIQADPNCAVCGGTGKCTSCKGTGACYWCGGTGKCSECDGKGEIDGEKCSACDGSGVCEWCHGEGECYWCKGTGKCDKCILSKARGKGIDI